MGIQGWAGGLYKYSEWTMRLVYVHLLWLLFTVIGLGIFGWAPSSVAAYATFRQWLRKQSDFSIFKCFWKTYREEFFKANLFGWIYVMIGIVFIVDLRFFQSQDLLLFQFLYYIFVMAFVIFLMAFVFIFPVYVHYDLKKNTEYMKYSLFIPLSHPLYMIMMIAVIVGVYFLYQTIPILLIFFGGAPLFMIVMWFALRLFSKIAETV